MEGMEVLIIYNIMAAWFLSPPEDTMCLLQCLCRLNQELNTGQQTVYGSRVELNGVCLVLRIDSPSTAALQE